jgi:FKBP-type peptidyl-prolyl cis-trans isomerase
MPQIIRIFVRFYFGLDEHLPKTLKKTFLTTYNNFSMKQFTLLVLAIALLFSVGGCKGSKKSQTTSTTKVYAAGSQEATDQKLILDYLKTNKIKNYKTTASGVYYVVEKEGSKEKPNINSKVNCHYRGTLLNGTEFDSSYKRNQPIEFPLTGVIKGWQEGIPTIGSGGKVKLLIPSGLAYGSRAMPTIPANSVLIFDVELLDFK